MIPLRRDPSGLPQNHPLVLGKLDVYLELSFSHWRNWRSRWGPSRCSTVLVCRRSVAVKGKLLLLHLYAVLIGRFFQGSTSALPLVLGFSLKVSSLWVVASWFLCESNSNLDHLFCLLLTFYYPFNVNGINSCRTTSFLILTICVFSLSFQGTKFSLILFINFLFLILLASFLIFIISFLCLL